MSPCLYPYSFNLQYLSSLDLKDPILLAVTTSSDKPFQLPITCCVKYLITVLYNYLLNILKSHKITKFKKNKFKIYVILWYKQFTKRVAIQLILSMHMGMLTIQTYFLHKR